jgi:hypothetical protein
MGCDIFSKSVVSELSMDVVSCITSITGIPRYGGTISVDGYPCQEFCPGRPSQCGVQVARESSFSSMVQCACISTPRNCSDCELVACRSSTSPSVAKNQIIGTGDVVRVVSQIAVCSEECKFIVCARRLQTGVVGNLRRCRMLPLLLFL